MNFSTSLVFSVGRSAFVAVTAAIVGRCVSRLLTDSPRGVRSICWTLLIIPWLIPGLLVGYAWNDWVFAVHSGAVRCGLPWGVSLADLVLRHDRICNEIALCFLLFSRCLPWAVFILRWGARGGESDSSWFLRGLSERVAQSSGLSAIWTSCRRHRRELSRLAPAIGLAFISCFQEFELVARLGRPGWTGWLIDAQATGVSVSGLLFRATVAAGLQTFLVGGILPVRQGLFATERGGRIETDCGGGCQFFVVGMMLLGAGATVAIPIGRLTPGFIFGISALVERTAVLRRLVVEVSVGGAVAACAATAAILLARFLRIPSRRAEVTPVIGRRLHFPGRGWLDSVRVCVHWLVFWLGAWGAVPLCLLTLCSLAALGLSSLSQTLFPWCFVQSLWLFPRAVCLISLIQVWRKPQIAFLGSLLAGAPDADRQHSASQLWWRENWRNRVIAGLFLANTAYFDLPTGQLLAPAGLASAPVTLYTQMHYGRNSLLTAMTLLAVAIPWTLAVFILMVLPRLTIWGRRRLIPLGRLSRSR